MAPTSMKNSLMSFDTIVQARIPQGRNGKHKDIVTKILHDLDRSREGSAIKIPLAGLRESKEKVRSALNRAVHKEGRKVATSSDGEFLYVWNMKD